MADRHLGRVGKLVTWGLYLFLFYSLMTAYVAGVSQFIGPYLPPSLDPSLIASLLFLPILFFGLNLIGSLNIFLIFGLVLTFFAFIGFGFSEVEPFRLGASDWSGLWLALPIVFTSFSFQGTVPSVANFLGNDEKRVKAAIWVGTSIPFLMYLLWEILVLGVVPKEELLLAKEQGLSAVIPLKLSLGNSSLEILGELFAFFALFTSFIGVSIGLFDFLADGLKMEKKGIKKVLLALFVLAPPLLLNLINPHLFLKALGVAGGIGCATLLGMIPILMVWKMKKNKLLLVTLLTFLGLEVLFQLF